MQCLRPLRVWLDVYFQADVQARSFNRPHQLHPGPCLFTDEETEAQKPKQPAQGPPVRTAEPGANAGIQSWGRFRGLPP